MARANIIGDTPADKVYRVKQHVKEYKMFTVLEGDEAAQVIAEAQMRGMYLQMLKNLEEFYTEWLKNNDGGNFVVPLNNEGGVFAGKGTDSLYTGINYALKKAELQDKWRMIKRDGILLITPKVS